MNAYKCDACGDFYEEAAEIKVCRRFWGPEGSWWGRMDICKECLLGLKEIWRKSLRAR